jgi:hypothetical protein
VAAAFLSRRKEWREKAECLNALTVADLLELAQRLAQALADGMVREGDGDDEAENERLGVDGHDPPSPLAAITAL